MQLLDSEQLEFALQAHGITLEGEARRFYTDVWNLIQAGEKIRDPLELGNLEQSLRRLCRAYFARTERWRVEEEERFENNPVCDLSYQNSREATGLLTGFERQFFRYALCYLELNRALIQKRAQLAFFARDYPPEDLTKGLNISPATGLLLERTHKERNVLLEKRLRMERVRSLLQQFDAPLEFLGAALPEIYGQIEGDHQLTLFKGYLRTEHFDRAQQIYDGWANPKIREPARKLVDMIRQHAPELRVQDKLMLHSGELSLIMAFLKDDEVHINLALSKYNVPYMVFQYQGLIRQGYLLGRVGSIEGLIIHHAKLTALAARMHNDDALSRMQEGTVLVPTRLMFAQNFKALGAILSDMETICAILEKLFAQTRDYMRRSGNP